ncbi:hypothetical protein [Sphingomonas sp. MMS24-J13]|uniref:hypothetical protein n=1 Tax=Sphingomonas sp. MMS24-J13 TaxID=3238686 RepID=UPI00384B0E76
MVGDQLVFGPAARNERASLLAAGRTDLAKRIRWVSHVDGDGAGYDILSFGTNGSDRLTTLRGRKYPVDDVQGEPLPPESRRSFR